MSTYMPKAADISRNWYVLDADGKTLGPLLRRLLRFFAASTSRHLLLMLTAAIT